MANTYYIDWKDGKNENNGLSPETPKKSHEEITLCPGDTVLFKRGGVIRSTLKATSGTEEGIITYGAYGEGENPTFIGSHDISSPSDWVEESANIWKYVGTVTDEPCNIIYNGGTHCGKLVWEKNLLEKQGQWVDTDMGNPTYRRFTRQGSGWVEKPEISGYKRPLYIYSEKNPGEYYNSIEFSPFGIFAMAAAVYARFENLNFRNNGVHGIVGQHDLQVYNCEFHFLGGACFDRNLRIRFGNGVESFEHPSNVTVENCLFNNVYDSCITHQGFVHCTPGYDMNYRHNLMVNYGMAAYELRDHIPVRSSFTDNICINAGCGFSAHDLNYHGGARQSEIWPFSMGHHVFIWRIAVQNNEPEAKAVIKRNIFYNAPYGGALFSFILNEPEKQYDIDENVYYTENPNLLNRVGQVEYKPEEFDKYVEVSGLDKNSRYEKIDIRAAVRNWYKECGKGEVSDETLDLLGII